VAALLPANTLTEATRTETTDTTTIGITEAIVETIAITVQEQIVMVIRQVGILNQ
jgi:hypothetical protein